MASKHLANWIYNLKYGDLPANVIQASVRSFYNWVGCAIGGSNHPATLQSRASLIGRPDSLKSDPSHAALLNGIASHVHAYDDTHLDTIIHPTGPVASALLAVAECKGGVSGKDFLLALIAGIEAECKLGLAVWPEHYDVGWHITSTTGSIGAAAAVSKILNLSVEQITHALGVAATQVVGLREMFGSHTKSFHCGRAAQNGLLAAMLAQGGYTSSEQAIEAKRGWVNVVGVTKESIDANLEKWLGMKVTSQDVGLAGSERGRWEILRNSFKPYPCGIVIHPVIDCCAQLHQDMRNDGRNAQNIKSVRAAVHPLLLELTGKRKPKDGLEGKFSVFHGAAIGFIYGKATPSQYEDHVVQDPFVIEIREKVDAVADRNLGADETKIVMTMNDGRVLEKHVKHALGSVDVPMDDEMLQRKFIDQSEGILGGKTTAISDACWDIEYIPDIRSLFRRI